MALRSCAGTASARPDRHRPACGSCPTPRQWERVPSWEWHRAGVGPERSRTIVTARRSRRRPGAHARRRPRRGGPPHAHRCRASGCGPSAEVRQRAHGDPDAAVASATSTSAGQVVYALTGRTGGDDDAMLELLEPYAGHRYRVGADDRAGRRASSRAAARATRRWTIAAADRAGQRTVTKSSASRGGRSAAGGGAASRPRPHPSAPSPPAGRARRATTSWQNSVLDTHAEPRPSAASATSRFSTPAPMRPGTSRARRWRAARPGRRARRRRPGRARPGTARRRSTSPRRRRRATGSSVNPSRAQVLRPPLGHRVEQPGARSADSTSTKRHGVVWCGAGAVTAAATATLTARAVDRLVGERRAPCAGPRRTSRWPSRNMSSSAGRTSGCRAGPVVAGRQTSAASPRTTATGTPVELALDQVGGGGELVGDRDHGLLEARCRTRRRRRGSRRSGASPATPIAASASPSRQGRPKRVADHDRRRRRRAARAARPAAAARDRVRVDRQQHDRPRVGVAGVDPGRGQHEAVPGLDDPGGAAAGDDPHRLARRSPRSRSCAATVRPSALRHDLARDDDDVAVAQVAGRRAAATSAARSSPGAHLAASRRRAQTCSEPTVKPGRAARRPGRAPRPRSPRWRLVGHVERPRAHDDAVHAACRRRRRRPASRPADPA